MTKLISAIAVLMLSVHGACAIAQVKNDEGSKEESADLSNADNTRATQSSTQTNDDRVVVKNKLAQNYLALTQAQQRERRKWKDIYEMIVPPGIKKNLLKLDRKLRQKGTIRIIKPDASVHCHIKTITPDPSIHYHIKKIPGGPIKRLRLYGRILPRWKR